MANDKELWKEQIHDIESLSRNDLAGLSNIEIAAKLYGLVSYLDYEDIRTLCLHIGVLNAHVKG